VRPASGDPARPEVLAILDRPASSSNTRELAPGKDRPGELTPEKESSRRRREQELSVRDDWTGLIDPDGDCKFDQNQPERKIRITVPGTPHLLSAELGRMNAPRLLRNVHGDFDALVTVGGVFHTSGRTTVKEYPPYHGAGILLWQDVENYVRLEIAEDLQHGKPRPYVNFEYRRDGALAASRGQRISNSSSYLRMRRRGDEIHAAFGPDGVHWTPFPPLTVTLKDWLNIGVSAINTATKPLTAELTDFMISGPLEVKGDADTPMIKP
jgi:regulation of enolase protein 1 (concanavalin A-like superfamily)